MSETLALLRAMHANEADAVVRVGAALEAIARAVDAIAGRLAAGGRWIYAGAGTSGRLAALDAAELPPTFGTDPKLVVAVLAGGPEAMRRAIEGAEDDEAAAARDLAAEGLTAKDAVVAVSASGRTPYALAALRAAREAGALTVAVACTRGAPLLTLAEHPILVDVGPEVVSGSTRLSAGTAQKLVLNMLSTAVMTARGLVVEGEMVAVTPTNAKLRARAVRIVSRIGRVPEERARELLAASEWDVPSALVAGRLSVSVADAAERLRLAGGDVARVLGD